MSNIGCILYPPTLDYYYLVQRPQQLMKSFSELDVPAYYINNPSPQSGVQSGIERLNENFYLFNNVDPGPFLQNINPVVYYTSAAQTDSLSKYNPALVVFDSVDEPSEEFKGWAPYYHKALSNADVVLTTSDKLFNVASQVNPHTFLVPNGCDYDHFSNRIYGPPVDIANLPRPIIGYIGVVATWVDLNLIVKVADQYPDYSIVVVGPLYNVTDVPQRPNIHWLGFRDYEVLPAYAQNFDVGIIPFRVSSMIEAVNPIKMWEYMATGMPIVTTPMPEVRKFDDVVLVSDTDEEFVLNISRAIYGDTEDNRNKRIVLARENSWRVRAQLVIEIIAERLAQKGISGSAAIPDIADVEAISYPTGIVTGIATSHRYGITIGSSSCSSSRIISSRTSGYCSRSFVTCRSINAGRKTSLRLSRRKSRRPLRPRRDPRRDRRKIIAPKVTKPNVSRHTKIKVVGGPALKVYTERCVL